MNAPGHCSRKASKTVFTRLCVFRGGFDDLAAAQVAGASLALLAGLVDKSLCAGKLAAATRSTNCCASTPRKSSRRRRTSLGQPATHIAGTIPTFSQRGADMSGGRQREAAAEIEAEIDNIRAAWQWALESYNVEAILRAMQCSVCSTSFAAAIARASRCSSRRCARWRRQPNAEPAARAHPAAGGSGLAVYPPRPARAGAGAS